MTECEPECAVSSEGKQKTYSIAYSTGSQIEVDSCMVQVGDMYEVRKTIEVLTKLGYKSFFLSVDE